MQSRPTWWLVNRRPSGEINDPEPPLLKRTEASWMCFRNWSVTSNPYFCLTAWEGNWFTSHLPSSARQGNPADMATNSANRFVMSTLWTYTLRKAISAVKKIKIYNSFYYNSIQANRPLLHLGAALRCAILTNRNS